MNKFVILLIDKKTKLIPTEALGIDSLFQVAKTKKEAQKSLKINWRFDDVGEDSSSNYFAYLINIKTFEVWEYSSETKKLEPIDFPLTGK